MVDAAILAPDKIKKSLRKKKSINSKGVNEVIISSLICRKGQYHNCLQKFWFENKFYFK